MIDSSKVFLILATQRSGSTMIIEDMRNTKIMGTPEEYFIPWSNKKDVDWKLALESILRRASTPNDIVSIKIMANQIPEIEGCLASVYQGQVDIDDGLLFPYFCAIFKNSKPIVIRRTNTARQAISRHISRATGINHATANKEDEHFAGNLLKGFSDEYNSDVEYVFESIHSEVSKIANENAILDKVVEELGVKRPLDLFYESIVLNGYSYLDRIAKLMNISLIDDIPERKMVKLSNSKNQDMYNKYIYDYLYLAGLKK
ncbi:Stf0 family sulfotransferase [Psychrobacter glacincola]